MADFGSEADRNEVSQYVFDQVANNQKLKQRVDVFIQENDRLVTDPTSHFDMDDVINLYFRDIGAHKKNGQYLSFVEWFQKYISKE